MTTTFSAPDIDCQGCANAIKNALGRVQGIATVSVDVEKKTVQVNHEAPMETVLAALDKAGFPAQIQ